MGDAADMLMDNEQHAWDMHLLGLCEDHCHYCHHEDQCRENLIAEMENIDE